MLSDASKAQTAVCSIAGICEGRIVNYNGGGFDGHTVPGPNDRPDQREPSVIETPITARRWDRKAALSIDEERL